MPTKHDREAATGRPASRLERAAAKGRHARSPWSTGGVRRRLLPRVPRGTGRRCLVIALAGVLAMGVVAGTPGRASAAQPVNLGYAGSFAVLASSVANTNLTTVTGNLGVSPGSSVTGFPPGVVNGTTYAGDPIAAQAKTALNAAYNDAAGRTPTATVAAQLGGTTLAPGVYTTAGGGFSITGTLTLDAQSDPDAVFIFQASTLSTSNVSNIALTGGAQADNVFWQLSTAATLGTFSTFRGNVLSLSSAAVSSGAAVFGRVFSVNGTVTLQGTSTPPKTRVTVPNDPPTTTALTTSAGVSRSGQAVTFTATVSPVSGTLVPQGTVAFKEGSTVLGTDSVDLSGEATFATSALPAGQHPIIAVYLGGDTSSSEGIVHFAPSKSPQVLQTVTSSLWDDAATPAVASHPVSSAVVLGTKFRAAVSGTITGVRFYKGPDNTGTHVGSLWSASGDLLAEATFTGESASGWQQVNFATPVTVTANTTYVTSYLTSAGHFSYTLEYFQTPHSNGPLTALADGVDGNNGVYAYGSTSVFPTKSYISTNYWVDVVFTPFDGLWGTSETPDVTSDPDGSAVVVGTKFRAVTDGRVRGVRFYKGPDNTGTHTGSLWSASGDLLAEATFTGESASGWQQVNFASPVAINADTTYVISYHTTSGHISYTAHYFDTAHTGGPLTALANGDDGPNGVYAYSAVNAFPGSGYQATNYWVDVAFDID
ncbi:DUF4082 domain-containing protein [Streptosporangium sp. NPDC051023]|uniref:DUF4082 domain-containing protein n=1 Tax=Streptosporangium sp. NPDC051023 TaxID=3155410 RepID=UPI00344CE33A